MKIKFNQVLIVVLLGFLSFNLPVLAAKNTAPSAIKTTALTKNNYINLSAYYLMPGQIFTVNGFYFNPNEKVTITAFKNKQVVIADNGGSFVSAPITVPNPAIGKKSTILAKGSASKNTVTAVLIVGSYSPTVTASTYFLMPGGQTYFFGEKFEPNEPVAVKDSSGNTILSGLAADSAGKFLTEAVTIPYKGSQQAYTFIGQNSKTAVKVSLTTANTPAYIILSNYVGYLDNSFQISGSFFGANENISLVFQGITLGNVKTDSDGKFVAMANVPATAASGLETITATGRLSGKTAQAKFLVNSTNYTFNNNQQPGY